MIKKSSFLKVKTILLLGVLFFAQITFAQVSKLAKLSEGKFIFYTPLSEEGWYSGNLYGYFFLYEKERTQRTEYTYEYVLLDKNLNKVYSGEFTEDFDKGANTAKYFSGTYENGKILFHINEYGRSTGGKFIDYEWYRVFDVKENKMSKAFGFDEKGGTYKSQEKDYSNPKVRYYYLRSVNEGFALHQSINWPYGVYYYSSLGNYESPAWFFKNSKENKQTQTRYTDYSISPIAESKDMLLLQETDMNKSKISDIRYKLIRSKDGSLITTLKMPDPDKKDSIMKTMTRYYDYNAGALKYEGNKIERNLTEEKDGKIKKFITEYYSLSTGEKTETRVFDLKKLSSQVGLSKDFYLKSCNIKELANGNILYIFEEVKEDSEKKKNKSVEFGDFVFAEINKNMEVVKSAKTHIEKRIFTSKEDMDAMLEEYKEQFAGAGLTFNKSNEKFLSSIIPLEDVKFIEKMEDDTTVVFYRKKNEEGTVTNLSVISYKDEVIKTLPDFPLKTPEGGKITFLPAKSGYFLLYEEFKDKDQSPELRLEKINY